VIVRIPGIGVYVVDIHEGKSESQVVAVHCVKAYGRMEACTSVLYMGQNPGLLLACLLDIFP
jgi:phage tail protein X